MKLAIMQPYLFPYLGYFQLIHAVDSFVVYDDVSYIKGGWINRNYILSQGNKLLITLPLQGASPNRLIKQIEVGGRAEKMLKTIRQCYGKAPQFQRVFPLLEDILSRPEKNLACFLDYGLRQVCDYLCLHPRWHISSMLNKDNGQRGPDKVFINLRRIRRNSLHQCSRWQGTLRSRKILAKGGCSFLSSDLVIFHTSSMG
jgi:hypothetical protein